MRRQIVFGGIFVVLSVAFGLYRLEYEVRATEKRLAQVNKEIASSQSSIQVLRAEWSFLNQPGRLHHLAEGHLSLAPMAPGQVGELEEIPLRLTPELTGEAAEEEKTSSRAAARSGRKGQRS